MTPMSPVEKAAQLRVSRALSQPGAKGKRGFLLWVAAVFPKKVSDAVALAASKHIPPGGFAGFGFMPRTQWKSPAMFHGLGDDSSLQTVGIDTVDLTPSTSQAVADATDSSPPDTSWVSDVASAFTNVLPALAQARLTQQQLANAQTIFNTNLQLAQQNKPLLPKNLSQYSVTAPTVNFGLSPQTLTPLLWVLGGVGVVWMLAAGMKHAR